MTTIVTGYAHYAQRKAARMREAIVVCFSGASHQIMECDCFSCVWEGARDDKSVKTVGATDSDSDTVS